MKFVGNRIQGLTWEEVNIDITAPNIHTPITYSLTYEPINKSVFVFLNGILLKNTRDYTVNYSGKTVTITSNQTLMLGDEIFIKYMR